MQYNISWVANFSLSLWQPEVVWLTLLIKERTHQALREVKVSCNCLSRHFFAESSCEWWNCRQSQPNDKCSLWFPADIPYSILQWAGDIISRCNLGMKYLREFVCLPNDFAEVIFSVGLLILIWPGTKSCRHPQPTIFFLSLKFFLFLKLVYCKIDFVVQVDKC